MNEIASERVFPARLNQVNPDLLAILAGHDAVLLGDELKPNGQACDIEQRQQYLDQHLAAAQTTAWRLRAGNAAVDDAGDSRVKDRFLLTGPGAPAAPVPWYELPAVLSQAFRGKRVLADLTSLGGSSVLQVHAAAMGQQTFGLSYLYLTPEQYPQTQRPDETPPVVTRTIKQPHGYRSFGQEQGEGGTRQHLIVLGFDRHRPNKFIEHYQWPNEEIRLLLCKPAYVEQGEEQARKSIGQALFEELECAGRVHEVNPLRVVGVAASPGVADTLYGLAQGVDYVDVVPLGPKPTLLAVAVFWHMLTEAQRERTRLLYDFPVVRQSRSVGIKQVWLYPNMVTQG